MNPSAHAHRGTILVTPSTERTESAHLQGQNHDEKTPEFRIHEGIAMFTAIVMIGTDANRIPEVAQEISELDGISEVYSVTGEWDLIAMVRVQHHDQLSEVIADRLSKVDGVIETVTQIAFRTYSRHDLDDAFSLGMD